MYVLSAQYNTQHLIVLSGQVISLLRSDSFGKEHMSRAIHNGQASGEASVVRAN